MMPNALIKAGMVRMQAISFAQGYEVANVCCILIRE